MGLPQPSHPPRFTVVEWTEKSRWLSGHCAKLEKTHAENNGPRFERPQRRHGGKKTATTRYTATYKARAGWYIHTYKPPLGATYIRTRSKKLTLYQALVGDGCCQKKNQEATRCQRWKHVRLCTVDSVLTLCVWAKKWNITCSTFCLLWRSLWEDPRAGLDVLLTAS